jgi:hypothetical protein
MGGDFEGKVSPPPKPAVADPGDGGVLSPPGPPVGDLHQKMEHISPLDQAIRYHVKDGKVHFHVDAEKLKVEVPVGDWWGAWEELKNLRKHSWRFCDHERGTMLICTVGLDDQQQFEAHLKVRKIAHGAGNIFSKLEEFTTKQRAKK